MAFFKKNLPQNSKIFMIFKKKEIQYSNYFRIIEKIENLGITGNIPLKSNIWGLFGD